MLRVVCGILIFFFCTGYLYPQKDEVSAFNGWHMSPRGRLHLLIIYAEIDFDSSYARLDPTPKAGNYWWKAGQLPSWKDEIISGDTLGEGFLTRYFRQASFGGFQVTGDYIDTIITVKISEVTDQAGRIIVQEPFANRHYKSTVLKKVNALDSIRFAHGSRLSDFDRWSFTGIGRANVEEANGKYDLAMIIFRNIHVANLGNHSGFVSPGSVGAIRGKGSDMYSIFRSSEGVPEVIMRHEFSHMLYGGNNFHTAAAGAGMRTFMPSVGGWSNMSAAGSCSKTWNAWDRTRLGWQNPGNSYLVNCKCAEDNTDVSGEIAPYAQSCVTGRYKLRDFISTGDAIRIKLPHIPEGVDNQYLWLENHQLLEGYIDHDKAHKKGLYAYIQVGKDITEGNGVFGGNNNYLYPLPAIGQYDFEFDTAGMQLHLSQKRANPLTGHHYLMFHPRDMNGDGVISLSTDYGRRSEYFMAEALCIEGKRQGDSMFCYKQYPIFGTVDVAFTIDQYPKMGLSHNPAAVPVYSHTSPGGPRKNDNRRIYLNGLSVEIEEVDVEGNLYIRLRWDDYEIKNDLRWCGDICLKEQLHIRSKKTITLDQGYTPQLAKAVSTIGEEPVFAAPTLFEIDSGAVLRMDKNARFIIRAGSSLWVKSGAEFDLHPKATILVEAGAYVDISPEAMPLLKQNLVRKPGAHEGISPFYIDRGYGGKK